MANGNDRRPATRPVGQGRALPEKLRAGVESLSGFAVDDVRVHLNSHAPTATGALAFTQGNQIFVGPGQERQVPHEVFHVVQQRAGRVPGAVMDEGFREQEAQRFNERAKAAGQNTEGPADIAPGSS